MIDPLSTVLCVPTGSLIKWYRTDDYSICAHRLDIIGVLFRPLLGATLDIHLYRSLGLKMPWQ
jgi:hypothetical protein